MIAVDFQHPTAYLAENIQAIFIVAFRRARSQRCGSLFQFRPSLRQKKRKENNSETDTSNKVTPLFSCGIWHHCQRTCCRIHSQHIIYWNSLSVVGCLGCASFVVLVIIFCHYYFPYVHHFLHLLHFHKLNLFSACALPSAALCLHSI